jgi:hypothetical protein
VGLLDAQVLQELKDTVLNGNFSFCCHSFTSVTGQYLAKSLSLYDQIDLPEERVGALVSSAAHTLMMNQLVRLITCSMIMAVQCARHSQR